VKTPMDRRSFLAAATSAALSPQLASAQQQPVRLRVGYVPVIGASALFMVADSRNSAIAGFVLDLVKFDSGPAGIQALASGTMDLMAIGIAPIAVARSKGIDVRVVASCALGGSGFAARGALARAFAAGRNADEAFAAFRRDAGRPAKIGTLPPGAVPTVALQYWLRETAKVATTDVEIVPMGIEAVQQAMLAGAIDGGTLLEPSLTLVLERDPTARQIIVSTDMFPRIPGVVIAARGELIREHTDAVISFVAHVIKATRQLTTEPGLAAPVVATILGGGLVSPATMEKALKSRAVHFTTDPTSILEDTRTMLAYQVRLGDFAVAPPTDDLFDQSIYPRAASAASAL
jgi:NitT/TauT family transport system substrate-binding protein